MTILSSRKAEGLMGPYPLPLNDWLKTDWLKWELLSLKTADPVRFPTDNSKVVVTQSTLVHFNGSQNRTVKCVREIYR